MTTSDQINRDFSILADRISGKSVAQISEAYGLRPQRIREILRRRVVYAKLERARANRLEMAMAFLKEAMAEISAQNSNMRKLLIDAGVTRPEPPPPVYLASIGLDRRTFNAMEWAGLRTVQQACDLTDDDLLSIPNFGTVSLYNLRTAVSNFQAGLKEERDDKS